MESVFFENDWKRHMSVNVETGLWQCFKSARSGNFISLYAHNESIPYFRAQRDLIIKNFEFLGEEIPKNEEVVKTDCELDINKLIPINIESADSSDQKVLEAWYFLFGRRLFNESQIEKEPYYLCKEGKFSNRIIIPFRSNNIVYYFQGRALADQKPKYLNPSTEAAPKPSDIVYPYDEDADHLVVCEGPLDAISLQLQGVNATATIGSSVSSRQAEIFSTFSGKIILGYDNDEAGQRGVEKFDILRKQRRMENFYVCPPPSNCKDWNQAHIQNEDLKSWVLDNQTVYDFDYKIRYQLEKY